MRHRLLGYHDTGEPGPAVLIVACLHGNEISGGDAAMRVLHSLRRGTIPFRGSLTAVIGNVPAYEARLRLIDEDLNRIWTRENVDTILTNGPRSIEQEQLFELRSILDALSESTNADQRFLLDLHTTSAASAPFIAHAGNGRARDIVRNIGAIEVRKVTDYLDGMLVKHTSELGWASLAFEAGSHLQADSVDIHETSIWQALSTAGMIEWDRIPLRVRARNAELQPASATHPPVEVIHHHVIQPGDNFRMRPGYANFQPINAGEILAEDRNGPITSAVSGRIFLPLYQNEGRDGFFIVQDVGGNGQDDA